MGFIFSLYSRGETEKLRLKALNLAEDAATIPQTCWLRIAGVIHECDGQSQSQVHVSDRSGRQNRPRWPGTSLSLETS